MDANKWWILKKLCRRQREQLKFCISNKAMPRTKDSMSLFDCNLKLETEERLFELQFSNKEFEFIKNTFSLKNNVNVKGNANKHTINKFLMLLWVWLWNEHPFWVIFLNSILHVCPKEKRIYCFTLVCMSVCSSSVCLSVTQIYVNFKPGDEHGVPCFRILRVIKA